MPDTFFSPSSTVFDAPRLRQSWSEKPFFIMAEIGFGSGLNFLNIWQSFERDTPAHHHLHYYALEPQPLPVKQIQKALAGHYPLRVGGWHTLRLSPKVTLTLIFDSIDRALPEMQNTVDNWMLNDWTPTDVTLPHIKRLCTGGTSISSQFTTDAMQNAFRAAGFKPSITNHALIGTFENETVSRLASKKHPKKIAIIGGGIAGASLAHALSLRECDVTLFEKNGLASGGSGNDRGLCNPRISASKGAEADFYSPAYNLAHHLFANLSQTNDIGFKSCGSLHMISDANKDKRYHGFKKNWGWHDDHARILNADESSDIAGVKIFHPSLYFEGAGMVSPRKATERLASSAKIILRDITHLEENGSGWRIDGEEFDCVILAGSFDVLQFTYTRKLPIEKIRGQVTKIAETPSYSALKVNLCYGGYASVSENGEAILGSTFQTWIDDPALRTEDDVDNIEKLNDVVPHLAQGLKVIGGRASFRSAAKDRAPVIGQIHGVENLYVSTAHGSHGILSSVMGAEYLVSRIMGDAHILPKSVERFLSPSRFKIY